MEPNRFSRVSSRLGDKRKVEMGERHIRLHGERFVDERRRGLWVRALERDHTPRVLGRGHLGRESHRLAQVLIRLIELVPLQELLRQLVPDLRVARVEAQKLSVAQHGFIGLPGLAVGVGEIDDRQVIVGFELNGLLVAADGRGKLAFFELLVAESHPRVDYGWVFVEHLLKCLDGRRRAPLAERCLAGAAHSLARLLASAPERSLRDGPRALAMATRLLETDRVPPHAETLAMALAEVRRFEDATRAQRAVLAEARRLNRTVDAERLAHNLARYEGSTACCADPTDAYPPVMPKSPFAQKR